MTSPMELLIRESLTEFNEKQERTKRKKLNNLEMTVLVRTIMEKIDGPLADFRSELEAAAAAADNELVQELGLATDIIVASIRQNNALSAEIRLDTMAKLVAGFALKITNEDGVIELELVKT